MDVVEVKPHQLLDTAMKSNRAMYVYKIAKLPKYCTT